MASLAVQKQPMTVAAFLAFGRTRPDGEKWELLEGKLLLNASPVNRHQLVVAGLIRHLGNSLSRAGRTHVAAPGIGVRLSDDSAIEPDVMIRPRDSFNGNICDDIIVAFEVLSPSTRHSDLIWKRQNYPLLTKLSHYVVVSAEAVDVRVFARAAQWREVRLSQLEDAVRFETLGVALTLADIYEDLSDLPGFALS